MMTIGICMIVRDAASTLRRALRSCTFASQIVVVDTGSIDNTPSIALQCGAELHFLPWRDNFSFARNYALRLMRTSWVLQLDADEYIEQPDIWEQFINTIHEQQEIGGARIILCNSLESGKTEHHHTYTRLFRRHHAFHYEGAIHEQIAPSIEKEGLLITELPLRIVHTGYEEINQKKYERNAAILASELLEKPDDPFLQYHAGNTAFALNDYARAREHFLKAYQTSELSDQQHDRIRMRLAQIAIAQSEYAVAHSYVQESSADTDIEGLRYYLLASLFAIEGKYREAHDAFHRSVSSPLVNSQTVAEFIEQLSTLK